MRSHLLPKDHQPERRYTLTLTRSEQMALTTLISDYLRTHGTIDKFVDCSTPGGVETTPEDLLKKVMEATVQT